MTDSAGDERFVARVSPPAANIDAGALHKHKAKHDVASGANGAMAAGATGDNNKTGASVSSALDAHTDVKPESGSGNAQISLVSLAADNTTPPPLAPVSGSEGQYLPVLQLFGAKSTGAEVPPATVPALAPALDNAALPAALPAASGIPTIDAGVNSDASATPAPTAVVTAPLSLAQLDQQTPASVAAQPDAKLKPTLTTTESLVTPSGDPTGLTRAQLLAQLDQQIGPPPANAAKTANEQLPSVSLACPYFP